MRIELRRGRDGPPTLVCIRADGTRTWSRLHPFFPAHDLLHFAVETTLGSTGGFYGLVDAGWSIDDFAAPGASGRMGLEALVIECIVGLLDQERAADAVNSPDAFADALAAIGASRGWPPQVPPTGGQLQEIRQRHGELLRVWESVPDGTAMQLDFLPRA